MSGEIETNQKMSVAGADGIITMRITDVGYIQMPPATARDFAKRLLHAADDAEGKKPTHMFIIPVGDTE